MKKVFLGFVLCFALSSFVYHQFFVSIYQFSFVPQKSRVEITTRIFVDDLNRFLSKNKTSKTHIGDKFESATDLVLLQKMFDESLHIQINHQPKKLLFLSKELDGNVLVCYLKITDVVDIQHFEIENNCLMGLDASQQNIIQINFFGKKQSEILTSEKTKWVLDF